MRGRHYAAASAMTARPRARPRAGERRLFHSANDGTLATASAIASLYFSNSLFLARD